jgi:hypothetical protein
VRSPGGTVGAGPDLRRIGLANVDIDLTAEGTEMPSVERLLSRADQRMYAVKERRRTG